jgi:hypothetical protein
MLHRRAWFALVVASLVRAAPARADGVRCPTVDAAAPALVTLDARRRLAFVRDTLQHEAMLARRWSVGWSLAGFGLAAGNFVLVALASTADARVDPIVGGATALVIPAAIVIKPLRVMDDARALENAIARSAGERAALCNALARGEQLLALSAEDEAESAGPFAHAFAIVGNAAVALFLGLGFDHWEGALLNGGGGLVISEFEIWTQPTGAVPALARYRRGEIEARPARSFASSLRIAPRAMPSGGVGLLLEGHF